MLMHPPANKKIRQLDYKDIYEITEMLITKWENIFANKCGIVELESLQSKPECRKVSFSELPENDPLTFIETNSTSKRLCSNNVGDIESSDENEDDEEDLTIIKSIKISLSTCEPLVQEKSPLILVFIYVLILCYVTLMFTSYII